MSEGFVLPVPNQRYQMWDYSPSHRTLLIRSPGSGGSAINIDLKFTGVRKIEVQTVFTLTQVRADAPVSIRPVLNEFILLDGEEIAGRILAEEVTMSVNSKGLFEALPDAGSRNYEGAAHLEVEVHAALRALLPAAGVYRFAPSDEKEAADFEVVQDGGRAMVDVMWTSERSAEAQAAKRVALWAEGLDSDTSLVIISGGTQAVEVAGHIGSELARQMPTSQAGVVAWTPDDREQLRPVMMRALGIKHL